MRKILGRKCPCEFPGQQLPGGDQLSQMKTVGEIISQRVIIWENFPGVIIHGESPKTIKITPSKVKQSAGLGFCHIFST